MSVEKITNIGGMTRLKKDGIGFTVFITQVERAIKNIDTKGFYIHMLGYPENWKFYRSKLMEELLIGKDRLKRCIDELKELGLIVETEVRDEKGRFIENQIHISLGIMLAPQFRESPQADYPHTGEPASGKQPTINKNTNINKNTIQIADSKTNTATVKSKLESLEIYRWKEWQKIYPDCNTRNRCLSKLKKLSKQEFIDLLEGTKFYLEKLELVRSNGFPSKRPVYATTFLNNRMWETTKDELKKYENELKQNSTENKQPQENTALQQILRNF